MSAVLNGARSGFGNHKAPILQLFGVCSPPCGGHLGSILQPPSFRVLGFLGVLAETCTPSVHGTFLPPVLGLRRSAAGAAAAGAASAARARASASSAAGARPRSLFFVVVACGRKAGKGGGGVHVLLVRTGKVAESWALVPLKEVPLEGRVP